MNPVLFSISFCSYGAGIINNLPIDVANACIWRNSFYEWVEFHGSSWVLRILWFGIFLKIFSLISAASELLQILYITFQGPFESNLCLLDVLLCRNWLQGCPGWFCLYLFDLVLYFLQTGRMTPKCPRKCVHHSAWGTITPAGARRPGRAVEAALGCMLEMYM